ncbi:MAG TPA: PQQ-dependent sugar dehydrogenase [Planctomycetota bacterium]|nr:PQQ-dependent sugar dehydrogenase [Planctomycetota bacterium]
MRIDTQHRLALVPALAGLAALAAPAAAQIQSQVVVQNLAAPLFVTQPRGDDRLFVLEQNQADVEIIQGGAQLGAPFLDLTGLATTTNERGLLGLAFHPDYDQNGYFFVNFTGPGGATHIERYTVSAGDPNVADVLSRKVLLTIAQPFANHNGGWLGFGPDGYLYIATGDGGSANDPFCNAQNGASLLGKMLRLDVDTIDISGQYSVPATNPFLGVAGFAPEIYHLGLRNPFRCAFDPVTGDMLIGDVGQDAREEVSFAPAGVAGINFGWRVHEGLNCLGLGACPVTTPGCGSPGYTPPIHQYSHGVGGICTVIGGYRYRGYAIPSEQGKYFFADHCSDAIWSFQTNGTTISNFQTRTAELALTPAINAITSFGTDSNRELYIISQAATGVGGRLIKVVPTGAAGPLPEILTDWDALSIVEGGVQRMTLNAGAGHGGKLYFLVGSTSGTVPGLLVDGLNVPLNLDAYMLYTVSNPNSPTLMGSLGFLDSTGSAQARLTLPAGLLDASAIGVDVNHAFVAFSNFGQAQFVGGPSTATLY